MLRAVEVSWLHTKLSGGSDMLEQCPTCTAKVLFTTDICPRCLVDRTNSPPSKVADWRLHNELATTAQKELQTPRKWKGRFTGGVMLIIGSFFVARAAIENSQYIRSMGFPHSPRVGLTISVLMKIVGILLICWRLFGRKR
jgi:hypothetical protein